MSRVIVAVKRYLYEPIQGDLTRKILILTGRRQIEKTFLAKRLLSEFQRLQFLNYDAINDRRILRTKEGKEVDFAVCKDEKLVRMIEIKNSDDAISRNLRYFSERLPDVEAIQLVHQLRHEQAIQNISVISASRWLAELAA